MATSDNPQSAVNWPWQMMTDVPRDGTWVTILQRGGVTVNAHFVGTGSRGYWHDNNKRISIDRAIGWQHRKPAPPKGPWIMGTFNYNGVISQVIAHYACDLSGEDQPPFEGWFTWRGSARYFWDVPGHIVDWRELTPEELASIPKHAGWV